MGRTKIEWTDKVWNPVTGCSKVSAGCKNCYAERQAKRFWGDRKFTDVRFHQERLEEPLHWKKPCRIFVCSMGDLFHTDVKTEWIDSIIEVMEACEWHTFIVLTKLPELMDEKLGGVTEDNPLRALGGGDYVLNLWLGVSVENQETADERIPVLLKIPAEKYIVCYEPALGPVDLARWLSIRDAGYGNAPRWELMRSSDGEGKSLIDWVIAGGETGPHARPAHPDWFRAVRDQCQAAGVPFFFKQWGGWLPYNQARFGLNIPNAPYRCCIAGDGKSAEVGDWLKVGKRRAGRLLDGKEWNEMPEVNK